MGFPVSIRTGYINIFAPVYLKKVMCLAEFGLINWHRMAQLNKRGRIQLLPSLIARSEQYRPKDPLANSKSLLEPGVMPDQANAWLSQPLPPSLFPP